MEGAALAQRLLVATDLWRSRQRWAPPPIQNAISPSVWWRRRSRRVSSSTSIVAARALLFLPCCRLTRRLAVKGLVGAERSDANQLVIGQGRHLAGGGASAAHQAAAPAVLRRCAQLPERCDAPMWSGALGWGSSRSPTRCSARAPARAIEKTARGLMRRRFGLTPTLTPGWGRRCDSHGEPVPGGPGGSAAGRSRRRR
jgi:hypothetical protein